MSICDKHLPLAARDIPDSHALFLSKGVPFPKNYLSLCRKILTRLYRVFVHVYIHHFDKMVGMGAVSSLILLQSKLT